MQTKTEKINQLINELSGLVQGTDAGLVLAYTGPEEEASTQVLSIGRTNCLAANYLAIQGNLVEDAQKSEGCNCVGCSSLRAIAEGVINYSDYEESQEKPTHTFVIETPEDLENALKSIFKGEI